jgi:hypothetical protein
MGQSESRDELRLIDEGTLVLTTKRLTFMGSLRTTNVSLDDIVTIESYTDGIKVHRERKQRPETYVLGQQLQITQGSGKGLTVFGFMIEKAIQHAKLIQALPPPRAEPIYRPQTPGANPLQYGSLYSSEDLKT